MLQLGTNTNKIRTLVKEVVIQALNDIVLRDGVNAQKHLYRKLEDPTKAQSTHRIHASAGVMRLPKLRICIPMSSATWYELSRLINELIFT